MRVRLVGEPEVAAIFWRIHGLLERAQHHHLQQGRIGALLDLLQHLGVVLRGGLVAAGQLDAEPGEELAQRRDFLRRRWLMHAVERGMFVFGKELGGADVGCQHAFFDEAVRVGAHLGHDARDLAVLVELNARLHRLEVDRPTLAPRFQKRPENGVEMLQVRQELGELRPGLFLALIEGGGDLGVGEAGVGIHHCRVETVALHLARGAHDHVAGHAQPIFVRHERAQAVAQLLRQHGNDPARKIDRVAAIEALGIERRAGVHIVGHVGDRHDQPEPFALRFAIDGVVEILGRLAVDGHERQFAQVHPPGEVLAPHRVGQAARFLSHLGRPFERQVELAQRDFDLHAGIVVIAQYLDDPPDRLGVFRRLLDELDHHHLPRFGLFTPRRDEDVLGDTLVLGHHQSDAVLDEYASDHFLVGAFEHLHDLAFGPAAAVGAGDAHDHPVAVQYLAHFLGPEEDVLAAVVADHETEAVGMALHAAADEVGLLRQEIGAAAVAQDLAIALHRLQAPLEELVLLRGDVERLHEFAPRHGTACLGKHLEDVFPTGQRMPVLGRLAGKERILAAALAHLDRRHGCRFGTSRRRRRRCFGRRGRQQGRSSPAAGGGRSGISGRSPRLVL